MVLLGVGVGPVLLRVVPPMVGVVHLKEHTHSGLVIRLIKLVKWEK